MNTLANARRTRLKSNLESVRLSQYGPLPVNYLKTVREEADMTLEAMSRKCGISKHALIRLEQGTYERILPSVLEVYVRDYVNSELTLVDEYEAYQSAMRERHHLYFGLDLITDPSLPLHPFRQLRNRLEVTPTEVAKALCIPQATIVHWEKHVRQQQSIPKCVANVLNEIGYKHEQILGLVEAYNVYRSQVTGSNVRKIGV